MTFDRGRHEAWEELISASLTGDLSREEAARLEAHLAACDRCRATREAFADGRRLMGGLRHVAPPRDLPARVRAGIESGAHRDLPWWRRPPMVVAGIGGGLAAVAGALLAIVLLQSPEGPPVAVGSPTTTTAASLAASPTPEPTLPPMASAAPSPASMAPAPTASAAEPSVEPTATPLPASPEPDVYLAVTGPFDNRTLIVRDGTSEETITELDTPSGPPIAAELSPDGQFLAYITRLGESGLTELWVARVRELEGDESPLRVGAAVRLGASIDGSPFLEQLSWSPNGRLLAFTLATEKEGTDAWVFDVRRDAPSRLTDTGDAYAGSWAPAGGGASLLWLSRAGEEPRSYLRLFSEDEGEIAAVDPADGPYAAALDVFQPLVSPNGAFVIYWSGAMEQVGEEWLFTRRGAPMLAENRVEGAAGYRFTSAREVFADLDFTDDGMSSAAIAWGPDSDAYAVWDASWTDAGASYPDPSRIYFGHALDEGRITEDHALDEGSFDDDHFVIDVSVAGTGRHLLVTLGLPVGGALDAPSADLFLVTRNTGATADEAIPLDQPGEGRWIGPAAFDPDGHRPTDP